MPLGNPVNDTLTAFEKQLPTRLHLTGNPATSHRVAQVNFCRVQDTKC
jgi:hypothetical protein